MQHQEDWKISDDGKFKVYYIIDTYKFYKKAPHSTVWTYNYTEYHWSFDGYKKINGVWVYDKRESGVDRVHADASSILWAYIKGAGSVR